MRAQHITFNKAIKKSNKSHLNPIGLLMALLKVICWALILINFAKFKQRYYTKTAWPAPIMTISLNIRQKNYLINELSNLVTCLFPLEFQYAFLNIVLKTKLFPFTAHIMSI